MHIPIMYQVLLAYVCKKKNKDGNTKNKENNKKILY